MLNTKEDILKNMGNITRQLMDPILFLAPYFVFAFFKISSFVFNMKYSYRFGKT